jgi:FkbM family methyltransferase
MVLGSIFKDSLKDFFGSRPAKAGAGPSQSSDPTPDRGRETRDEFVTSILSQLYVHVHQAVPDNYDHLRYSYDQVDRSSQFNVNEKAAYLKFFLENADRFLAAKAVFADEESADLYVHLILFRLLGHLHYRIRANDGWERERQLLQVAQGFVTSPSALHVTGLLGPIEHHEGVPSDGGVVSLDCWSANVLYTALKRQYYFDRAGVRIGPSPGNVIIDAGGCFGDTAIYFAKSAGPAGHVYSFDPLPQHGNVIRYNIEQNDLSQRVTYVPYAVGETSNDTPPAVESGVRSSVAQPGFSLLRTEDAFAVTSIDDFCEARALPKLDFLKMDIEGFELSALRGARKSIARFQPVLAISLYHRPEDLFEIPLWIRDTFPNYVFHLDHFTIHQEETVLYAVPAKQSAPGTSTIGAGET